MNYLSTKFLRFSNHLKNTRHSYAISTILPNTNPATKKPLISHTPCRCYSQSGSQHPKRIVVGVTGATGTIFAVHLLEQLRKLNVETHLVMSKWASVTLKYETDLVDQQLRDLATYNYASRDLAAPISSGSFLHDGMIIVPCSVKTLAAVRMGFCDDLISRAADVSLKEGRKLMMVVRETPLSDIHLDNMLALRKAGAIMFPPVPAFYTRPTRLEDLVNQSVGRMLDSFGIHTDDFERWNGLRK